MFYELNIMLIQVNNDKYERWNSKVPDQPELIIKHRILPFTVPTLNYIVYLSSRVSHSWLSLRESVPIKESYKHERRYTDEREREMDTYVSESKIYRHSGNKYTLLHFESWDI